MELNLKYNYKSLTPISLSLPNLTIITGVNGAGKTHLLLGLAEGVVELSENNLILNPFIANPKIQNTACKYISSGTLMPNESSTATNRQITQKLEALWGSYQNFQKAYKPNRLSQIFNEHISNQYDRDIIHEIAKKASKEIHTLSSDDFYNHYPFEQNLSTQDIFHQNFSILFKHYQYQFDNNLYNQFRYHSKGHDVQFLSDQDFLKKYGDPPWDFVNKILEEARLDYYINSPINDHRDARFELKLINKLNQAEIKFSDLSSGEKVLMSLALALYNSNSDTKFPKVLLMDEPDASLHPSMSKQFLDVIEKVFVQAKGLKVIITTHSPSTVALCDEGSLFMMSKTEPRMEKVSKDKALKILTAGVPSISINYENRRQIFVESPYDVKYYERFYQILSGHLNPEISLSFISSGDSRTDKNGKKVSNCDQVINITNLLRKEGNHQILGVIDWDSTNNGSDYIKLLGNGNRYSMENYIFDPVLLVALLLREKIIPREDLGLSKKETYTDFKHFDGYRLQKICDYLTSKLEFMEGEVSSNTDVSLSILVNGIQLNIPVWYLHHQGHSLEDKILKLYPQLNEIKKNKEETLKMWILDKVVDDIPELISVDILETFKHLQTC